jgi:hypothetical protein
MDTHIVYNGKHTVPRHLEGESGYGYKRDSCVDKQQIITMAPSGPFKYNEGRGKAPTYIRAVRHLGSSQWEVQGFVSWSPGDVHRMMDEWEGKVLHTWILVRIFKPDV